MKYIFCCPHLLLVRSYVSAAGDFWMYCIDYKKCMTDAAISLNQIIIGYICVYEVNLDRLGYKPGRVLSRCLLLNGCAWTWSRRNIPRDIYVRCLNYLNGCPQFDALQTRQSRAVISKTLKIIFFYFWQIFTSCLTYMAGWLPSLAVSLKKNWLMWYNKKKHWQTFLYDCLTLKNTKRERTWGKLNKQGIV